MPVPRGSARLKRASAKEKVYSKLKSWIVTGELQSGEKIIDSDIAEYFAVSRTPVREALQLLAAQKLVKVSPGRQTVVCPVDADVFRSCYQLLAVLQGFAAECACTRVTHADLAELEALDAQYRDALANAEPSEVIVADARLHSLILSLCGNDFLREFSDTLLAHVQRVEYLYFSWAKAHGQSVQTHRELIEALKARDRDRARTAMQDNWLCSMKVYEHELGSAPDNGLSGGQELSASC